MVQELRVSGPAVLQRKQMLTQCGTCGTSLLNILGVLARIEFAVRARLQHQLWETCPEQRQGAFQASNLQAFWRRSMGIHMRVLVPYMATWCAVCYFAGAPAGHLELPSVYGSFL